MPKQLRDAIIVQRSPVLSQVGGLVFRGTVTTYTSTTSFKIASFPGYGDATDFGDGFFDGYSLYCVWDSAGGGSLPQGEDVAVSGYTSADGTITHVAFTTPLAVGDEVLFVHPSVVSSALVGSLDDIKGVGFVTATDSLKILSDVLDDLAGVGFVTADDSLHAISTELDEILDLTRTEGDIAVTAAETNLYIDDAPTKILVGLSIKIDMTNMAAGDTYEFREYYRIISAGAYLEVADTITLSGVQSDPLYVMHLEPYRYGMKITAQKTAGTDRSFKIEVIREA